MFSKFKKQPPAPERRSRVPQQPAVRSNAVFSYHASRSSREANLFRDAEREQLKDLPRRKPVIDWAKKLPMAAAFLAVVVLAGLFLQLSGSPRIETAGTAGAQLFLREKTVYEAAVREAFTPWTNRNKVSVNTEKISADLRKQFPELQVVSVSLPIFGTQPTVYIQPAAPKLLLVSKSGMFVIDANGRALIAGNQVARLSELGVPVLNDDSDMTIQAGSTALPRNTVYFISEVVGQLAAHELKIASMTLPAGSSELHIKLEGAGYIVKCNLYGNAREEAGSYIAVKQWLEANKKMPREYVDVRVENKAYYK